MERLISVVVPVFNRAALLERTLRSVLAQTHRPIELLVVDNGSTDASLAVARSWQQHHAGIGFDVRVLSEPKAGASAARNTGLRLARGQWVSFFDSDDEMSPTFLADAVQAIDRAPAEPCVVAGRVLLVGADGRVTPKQSVQSNDPALQILTGWLSTQSFVVRTDYVRGLGGWDEALARWQDWELGCRLLLGGGSVLRLAHTYHRVYSHAQSITGQSFARSAEALLAACEAVHRDINEAPAAKRPHLLRALAWRLTLLSAWLQREGATTASRKCLLAARALPVHLPRPMNRLLWAYTAAGGRGAWRAASKML